MNSKKIFYPQSVKAIDRKNFSITLKIAEPAVLDYSKLYESLDAEPFKMIMSIIGSPCNIYDNMNSYNDNKLYYCVSYSGYRMLSREDVNALFKLKEIMGSSIFMIIRYNNRIVEPESLDNIFGTEYILNKYYDDALYDKINEIATNNKNYIVTIYDQMNVIPFSAIDAANADRVYIKKSISIDFMSTALDNIINRTEEEKYKDSKAIFIFIPDLKTEEDLISFKNKFDRIKTNNNIKKYAKTTRPNCDILI